MTQTSLASEARRVLPRRARRGVATLWLIITVPAVLVLLCVVVDVGTIWLARVELETALEASALASAEEWGDNAVSSADNWTVTARNRGLTLAGANCVRGEALNIATNLGMHDASTNPNENKLCDIVQGAVGPPAVAPDGNLVFGRIEKEFNGDLNFDASRAPSCGGGQILVDATGNGNLQTAANNEWGIAFHVTDPPVPITRRITRIELQLPAGLTFSGVPTLSDNSNGDNAVRDTGGSQEDNFGWENNADPSNQILFTISPSNTLTIDFSSAALDDGFAPGDRFRFGAVVLDGNSSGDGDEVAGTRVTVTFNNAPPVTAILSDTGERKNDCKNPHEIDPITGTWVVNPSAIPDLPCPPNNGVKNGQSYVRTSGSGDALFGVRAQATVEVKSLCCQYLGMDITIYTVSAKTTAMYDCATRRPQLVRLNSFICGPGNGADP